MRDVLERMSSDELLALAAMLSLHEFDNPTNATLSHLNAAAPEDRKTPFSGLPRERMIKEIEFEVCSAGGYTVANIFRGGKGVPYREVVRDVAEHVGAQVTPVDTICEIESKIAMKTFRTMLNSLSEQQPAELAENLELFAQSHGKSFATQGGVLVALTAAQLSGFGIYVAASTVVGAATGLLGFTLPFVFYATLSKVLAVVIGPIGWVGLGLSAIYRVGSPNMKKLVPAVLFIAAKRNE
jgi:uncharacterized protein YaaW (UPF0174 family)